MGVMGAVELPDATTADGGIGNPRTAAARSLGSANRLRSRSTQTAAAEVRSDFSPLWVLPAATPKNTLVRDASARAYAAAGASKYSSFAYFARVRPDCKRRMTPPAGKGVSSRVRDWLEGMGPPRPIVR